MRTPTISTFCVFIRRRPQRFLARAESLSRDFVGLFRRGCALCFPAPWQKLVDPRSRMVGQFGEDMREPGLRVHVVELASLDE
jgi:hypothetical protein